MSEERMFFPSPTGNHPKLHMPEASSGNAKQFLSFIHPMETGCPPGPLGVGLKAWAHVHPHALTHTLSQHQGLIRPIAWVSQCALKVPYKKKEDFFVCVQTARTANCIQTYILTFLGVTPQGM